MFSSKNKKNDVYPCKPQFYCIKVGFKGVKLYRHVFVMQNIGNDIMRFQTKQTPSFNLVYKSICYPSGVGTSKTMLLIATELQQ